MDDDLKMSVEETIVRNGQSSFVIKADPFYSELNMSVLRRRARDMNAGRNVVEHDLIIDGVEGCVEVLSCKGHYEDAHKDTRRRSRRKLKGNVE